MSDLTADSGKLQLMAEIERLRRVHDTNVLGYEAEILALKQEIADLRVLRGENSHLQVVLQNLVYRPNDPVCQRQARAALEGKP